MIFMWNCTRCVKIFYIFVFENTHLGIRIDAKTVFVFLFFLGIPLKNQRSMMKKTVKFRFFMFFINFPSLEKCFLNMSSHELNRDFQHHSTGLEIWKNRKSRKNCFSNFRRTAVAKTMFFQVFFMFFFHFPTLSSLELLGPRMVTPAHYFPSKETLVFSKETLVKHHNRGSLLGNHTEILQIYKMFIYHFLTLARSTRTPIFRSNGALYRCTCLCKKSRENT